MHCENDAGDSKNVFVGAELTETYKNNKEMPFKDIHGDSHILLATLITQGSELQRFRTWIVVANTWDGFRLANTPLSCCIPKQLWS